MAMRHRKSYRVTDILNRPGVYVLFDHLKTVIYVGKAKSLRKRLSNYFQPSRLLSADPKLRSLVKSIEYYEIYPVRNEEEALILESQFIKQHSPRYNVLLRDDKRFLLIKIDFHSPYPRLSLARIKKNDNSKYYGPFPQAGVLRETIDFLSRHFGLRSCRSRQPSEKDRRHCLDHIIRYCSAPCVQKINEKDYHDRVIKLIQIIEGKTDEVTDVLEKKMLKYSQEMNYESAAKTRDIIDNIRSIFYAQNRTFARAKIGRFPGPKSVEVLGRALNLSCQPDTIECFDISNISGSFSVGSMVQFKSGLPAKQNYRHYRIKDVKGIDDFAMIAEVVRRRYGRLVKELNPLPNLIIVDGGLGQLHSAYAILQELNIDKIPIIGLAKKQEEIFTIHSPVSIKLERYDVALKLLQAIRDEAHRFANSYHQKLRHKQIQNSILDEIPGIGTKRKTDLLNFFGSVKNLRRYNAEQVISRIPNFGKKLAEDVVSFLRTKRAAEP